MYIEYHNLLKKYKNAESDYYDALDKKSKLLYIVTPHGTEAKPIVNHLTNLSPDEKFNRYTREIEEIDLLINSTRNNKDVLEYELKKKEIELRKSNEVHDRVYVFKWLEHKKVREFYKLINYSMPQTYRFIDEIKEKIYKKSKDEKK